MRAIGVNYDTGMEVEGRTTRSVFDQATARRELRVIADELHAKAVRLSGSHLDRLAVAGAEALAAGLDLWFSPVATDLEPDELIAFLAAAATQAEHLRTDAATQGVQAEGPSASAEEGGEQPGEAPPEATSPEVVLVLGFEISLSCKGFVPGDTMEERLGTMMDQTTWTDPEKLARMQQGLERWGQVQGQIAEAARSEFGGRITYAAGMWEDVDWSLFDIVSLDAYRDAQNASTFREQVAERSRWGKPLAVTEFGCATYRGAADRGGSGWMIVDRSVDPPVINGHYERDEEEQVTYLQELAEVFDQIDAAAFWFSFAGYELPHDPDDPAHDLDLSAYGLVATSPDGTWRRKRAFDALAELNAKRV
ncbi:hypothetical protein [Kribbella sp. VKM Ac-2568]|uniref:hypothetical protein n=1 Tax=Kribbella sp. VKM Ac-2568 TaxID=2512219 RepID=UPI0010480D30|nr:hypothetical protein [Kribbella sp. VKM Ac-2568]TCM38941.1 hypothetical protein EV648_11558 [Kribbella sp. VKM Ac-2568]